MAADGPGPVLRRDAHRHRADGSVLPGPVAERRRRAAETGMRIHVVGPVYPAHASGAADVAGRIVRASAPAGEGRDDGPGAAVPGARRHDCAAAASILAHDRLGATKPVVW